MSDDADLQAVVDHRTLLRLLDEARAELAHRDKLDEFTKPLSCEVHGLVPNLASFGNNCPNCQMMLLANRCAKFAARITKADAEVERLRRLASTVQGIISSDIVEYDDVRNVIDIAAAAERDAVILTSPEALETVHWRSVTNQLPDDEQTVLTYYPTQDEPVWLGYFCDGCWYDVSAMPCEPGSITHWAAIPKGPQP